MQKEYEFGTILKEYNEIYGRELKLHPDISDAVVIHNIERNSFLVVYCTSIWGDSEKHSLVDFIRSHFYSINIQYFEDIMYRKEKEKLKLTIEIWPSNKIRYAYLRTNYFSGAGILGNSCMRYKSCQKSLNFYVKNNVRIVVLIDNKRKIHGRALLWSNINSTKRKSSFSYLDRVYTNSELLVLQFYALAKENKWKYYPSTSIGKADKSYYKKNIYVTDIFHFPYTDTFQFLYYKDDIIMSAFDSLTGTSYTTYITLKRTSDGGYFPEIDPNRIKEAITHNFISKKDAIFVKRYNAWVLKTNIAVINGAYYSAFDNNIIKTEMDGWILKENSVSEVFTNNAIDITKAKKSAKYGGYVHKLNALYIEGELYHKLDTDIICFKRKWYHISQCFVNYNREKTNKELTEGLFYLSDDILPYWVRSAIWDENKKGGGIPREGDLIPNQQAIIAYNLIYSPTIDAIEYQAVYLTSRSGLIQLVTGELVINSSENRKYLKKFNNKYYVKQDSELPDKNQLTLF